MKINKSLLALSLSTALTSIHAIANEQAVASGAQDFAEHCSACHGANGSGNSEKADTMNPKPSDLTLLSKADNGNFPVKRITDVIDGRPDKGHVRSHNHNGMPAWGNTFRYEKGVSTAATLTAERETNIRINNLVQYIRTIQK